jgi:hypothetical protein
VGHLLLVRSWYAHGCGLVFAAWFRAFPGSSVPGVALVGCGFAMVCRVRVPEVRVPCGGSGPSGGGWAGRLLGLAGSVVGGGGGVECCATCWVRPGRGGCGLLVAACFAALVADGVTLGQRSERDHGFDDESADGADFFRLGTTAYPPETTHDHGTDNTRGGRRRPAVRPAFMITASLGRHRSPFLHDLGRSE